MKDTKIPQLIINDLTKKQYDSITPAQDELYITDEEYRDIPIGFGQFASNKPAPTIDTGHRHHFHYKYNRVPTVRECARLQSFPDDFKFAPNTPMRNAYKQVGNSVCVPVVRRIAEQIKKVME